MRSDQENFLLRNKRPKDIVYRMKCKNETNILRSNQENFLLRNKRPKDSYSVSNEVYK